MWITPLPQPLINPAQFRVKINTSRIGTSMEERPRSLNSACAPFYVEFSPGLGEVYARPAIKTDAGG